MSTATCPVHARNLASDQCRECGLPHCSECLIYTHGPRTKPMCKNCALVVAGVRRGGKRPRLTRRQRRAYEKARAEEQARAAETGAEAGSSLRRQSSGDGDAR